MSRSKFTSDTGDFEILDPGTDWDDDDDADDRSWRADELRFNPHQPRDKNGKWASGGGGGAGSGAPEPESPLDTTLGTVTARGRQFTDPDPALPVTGTQQADMAAYAHRTHDAWAATVTETEADALEGYVHNGYSQINSALRQGKPERARKRIEALDSALARAETPERVVAYRGVKDLRKVAGTDLADAEGLVGTTLRDRGYMSLSLNREVSAQTFSGPAGGSHATYFAVSVPKGSKVAALDSLHPRLSGVGIGSESEVLASRGHGLKITAVRRAGGRTYIEADLVPPEA